ncbi:unnamed protein product, partial [Musa textilis]
MVDGNQRRSPRYHCLVPPRGLPQMMETSCSFVEATAISTGPCHCANTPTCTHAVHHQGERSGGRRATRVAGGKTLCRPLNLIIRNLLFACCSSAPLSSDPEENPKLMYLLTTLVLSKLITPQMRLTSSSLF